MSWRRGGHCPQECRQGPPVEVLEPPAANWLVREGPRQNRPFSMKHAQQQASIIGHMARAGLLQVGRCMLRAAHPASHSWQPHLLMWQQSDCCMQRQLLLLETAGLVHGHA